MGSLVNDAGVTVFEGEIVGAGGGSASWKEACALATTENVALTGLADIDFNTPQAGDRILVLAQVAAAENGIYVAAAGAWARAADANTDGAISGGDVVPVALGNSYAQSLFVLSVTSPPWIPGTSGDLSGVCVAGVQLLAVSGVNTLTGVTTLTLSGGVVNVVGALVLPTSDPGVPGALWNNAGTPAIS